LFRLFSTAAYTDFFLCDESAKIISTINKSTTKEFIQSKTKINFTNSINRITLIS